MLIVKNVSAHYSGITALRQVSLTVEDGEMVALIGTNGAGKSTLLNCICGLVPAEGVIEFQGKNVLGMRTSRIARLGLLQVPEGRQILHELSVEENLLLGKLALGGRRASYQFDDVIGLFPILGNRRNQRAGSLSGGEQQMLAIGRALMGAPTMLLLDEPSLGLAPKIVDQVFEVLGLLSKSGLTILLVEQNAKRALGIAKRAYILEQGRVVRSDLASVLADDPDVAAFYFGNLGNSGAKQVAPSI